MTTPTPGLTQLRESDVDAALEELLLPRLRKVVEGRAAGHCMRVDDLDVPLAARLTGRLRTATRGQIHVLGVPPEIPEDVAVSSTKVVELRNPDADERLRPPLLVFIPPGARTSAEDSFGVATFEQVELGDVYGDLVKKLMYDVPADLHGDVDQLFHLLDDAGWGPADKLARARYLLTVTLNGADRQMLGAALYELGLVPDRTLFDENVVLRANRNIEVVRKLTESTTSDRQRVLTLNLTDDDFQAALAEFVAEHGLADPCGWTRRIVEDRKNWRFFFDNWPLPVQQEYEAVDIEVTDLALPIAGENEENPLLQSIVGQPYLFVGKSGKNEMSLAFVLRQQRERVIGLERFRIQVFPDDMESDGDRSSGSAVEISTTAKARRGSNQTYKPKLTKLLKTSWEQGWYFVKVTPLDRDGAVLPVVASPDSAGRGHAANESDRFYVITDGDDIQPPVETRKRSSAGVIQATCELQFDALKEGRPVDAVTVRGVRWKRPFADGPHASGPIPLVSEFTTGGIFEIGLSPELTELQRRILGEPDHAGQLSLKITVAGAGSEVSRPDRATVNWSTVDSEAAQAFLAARRDLFARIRAGSTEDRDPEAMLPVEGNDLLALRPQIAAYAEAYQNLLIRQRIAVARADGERARVLLRGLNELARIDTVAVELTDHRWTRHELTLVAPTHPLKLLWLVSWGQLGRDWAARLGATTPDTGAVAVTRATLLDAIQPLGYPIAVPTEDGRLAVAGFDLTPYWEVCLLSGTADPQGLLALLAGSVHVPNLSSSSDVWSARALTDRLDRYLRQHPYVSTLVINAFNVGRAEEIAQALDAVQRLPALGDIGFELRLFVADPQAPGVAEAIAGPLSEGELDYRLSVSVLNRDEFLARSWPAHVTLLFDALSAEHVDTSRGEMTEPDAYAPVHGLVQEMAVGYDAGAVAWSKRPRHGRAREINDAEELAVLLGSLPGTISSVVATLATGDAETTQVPQVTLSLDVRDSTLLDEAHRVSDWVITVDRTLGIELFDSPASGDRPEYVIDYAPETGTELGHHIVVSSRSLEELRHLLRPVLNQQGVRIEDRHVATFFEQLRLLSGRLAFRIASTAASQRAEIFGLALARLYLEYQGVALRNQILVPLDAHLDLYHEARTRADAQGADVDLKRTDLALFDLDASRRTITCRLVEVKCHTETGLAGYARLKERIRGQLARSADVLAAHFDPAAHDRPDRAVKNHQLAGLLRFYLERGVRHRVIDKATETEARRLLDRLDADEGFTLEFTRTGLVFDLGRTGEDHEAESGVEFRWIGRDLVQELLDSVPTRLPGNIEGGAGSAEATEASTATLADSTLGVSRPSDAAFQPAPRISHEPQESVSVIPDAGPLDAASVPSEPEAGETEPVENVRPVAPENESDHDEVSSGPAGGEDAGPESVPAPERIAEPAVVRPDIFLGSSGESPQYGMLASVHGRRIAVDLNETHTFSLFGVQGGGKSYTLGSIIEMAALAAAPVNRLRNPLAAIVFHYSQTQDYAPEFTTMVDPNDDPAQIRVLLDEYGGHPAGLSDIVLLAPAGQCEQRRREYPELDVRPLAFDSAELQMAHWKFLMGAVGNQATYIRQLTRIMRENRHDLRLDVIRQAIAGSSMADHLKQLADQRLDLAAEYIDDGNPVKDLVRPGRLIIVDLRDEFIEKDDALGLFVVLMNLFAEARPDATEEHTVDEYFNKLVVFDEAHKYIDSPDLVKGLVESVREMRHKGMSVLVASQDPPSVPVSLIELSDHIFVHKCTSPGWLKHLKNANAAFNTMTMDRLADLRSGEAFVWSSKATDAAFTQQLIKVMMRPRITRHGGGTKTAVRHLG